MVSNWPQNDSKDFDKAVLVEGLRVIRRVLDYSIHSGNESYVRLSWTKEAIDTLLRGEPVREPGRE